MRRARFPSSLWPLHDLVAEADVLFFKEYFWASAPPVQGAMVRLEDCACRSKTSEACWPVLKGAESHSKRVASVGGCPSSYPPPAAAAPSEPAGAARWYVSHATSLTRDHSPVQ